jgi:hypothetical protein
MQSKYQSIHSSILRVDKKNLETIKTQVNTLKQNQKEERAKLIDKINKWTDSEKKIARRIINSIVTLTIYILLYARYDVETALFISILYNTSFVLYSNFRIYSQTQRVMNLESELKQFGQTYKSPFDELNFISLVFWLVFLFLAIAENY